MSLKQLADYPVRGAEVQELCAYVAAGGSVYPVSILQNEGMPYQAEG